MKTIEVDAIVVLETEEKLQEFSQGVLNDLARYMTLPKDKSERSASRLEEKCLLEDDVSISLFIKRNNQLTSFFSVGVYFCFCNNIDEMFYGLYQENVSSEWGLFIDSSKRHLKEPLLHNGDKKPLFPMRHSVHKKECYKNMQVHLDVLKYSEYKWNICGNLKVIGMLIGIHEVLLIFKP